MDDLTGKCAFVTGGASGIGFGMAEALAGAGMKVVIADIEANALEQAAAKLKSSGAAVHAIQLDVTDRAAMESAAADAEEAFGAVDVVCNNAGVCWRGFMTDASYDDWDWVLGVNLGGVVNGIRTFVPRLIARGEGGHVVNTASMAGLMASPGNSVYCTSKFAVVGLSEGLRKELAPKGIGVTVLCPAAVNTNINRAERNRPAELGDTSAAMDAEALHLLDRSFLGGTDPRDLGAMVEDAIRRDLPYVIPHQEYKGAFRGKVDGILDIWNDDEPPETRLAGAQLRQQAFARMRDR
ncbi:MAG: SDR family NAD(P)-dependent oxidoreductase [Rhodospirillales bacterium]|nr:short-chain dehydrogenase [Rhodospirillaceae bacterium]MDP6428914.1 SDR family NAD(P)-dependent oxidoreductase [Rhodospirillales bacterium]MDP6644941.1 SDR family NAD(P)-dependent oxidoreductase [Rhodospirillales bacterium]